MKAKAEEYARQKQEEQAILKEAEEARQADDKCRSKITSEERQRLQERVIEYFCAVLPVV